MYCCIKIFIEQMTPANAKAGERDLENENIAGMNWYFFVVTTDNNNEVQT